MTRTFILTVVALGGLSAAQAQTLMKDTGRGIVNAGKIVGRATGKAAKKAGRVTGTGAKKAVNFSARKVNQGSEKLEEKTR